MNLALWYNLANSSPTEPGSVGQHLRSIGWYGFVEQRVKPAIAWCEASGVTPVIELHLAFGQWVDPMHLDNYDYALAAGARWLTDCFVRAWRPIAARYQCVGYVGSVDVHPRLTMQPAAQLAETIRRNVRPFLEAGFGQIACDATSDAITHGPYDVVDPSVIDPRTKRPLVVATIPRSLNAFQLEVIDAMGFPLRTAIEAAPRKFREWQDLATRDVWIIEDTYQNSFGKNQHGRSAVLGYGTRDHLTGRVYRMCHGDSAQSQLAKARQIVADGDVAAVQADYFLQAGIGAQEIFAR